MYTEPELLFISALQHLIFCERQCALIHIEREWAENRFTAEGRVMHEKAHSKGHETRRGIRVENAVLIRSLRLGLSGEADVVEFRPDGTVFPVEYKRGRPKSADCDRIQLCAQALCLEEMLSVNIPAGALFYGKTRRREDVEFDVALRRKTESAARRLHELVASGKTPLPAYRKQCEKCSFIAVCMPKTFGKNKSAAAYINREINDLCENT